MRCWQSAAFGYRPPDMPKVKRGPRPPLVRRPGQERGLKVTEAAARFIRAGHPWVFRDSVMRPIQGLQPGSTVPVFDADGRGLGLGLLEPQGAIAARLVSRDPECDWTDDEIAARVKAALVHRQALVEDSIQTCHRVVHGEGDGLPGLAVDRLGDFLLIYKYSRAAESLLDTVTAQLVAQLDPAGVYLQDRTRPVTPDEARPGALLVHGRAAPTDVVVEEDGLSFLVDVTAPVSPGLFLDLREGRRLFETMVRGQRVLNLFSFTGAFGLRAVRGGASAVTNVDAAARSHTRCRQNLEASGMDPNACEAVHGDVFKHLERMRRRQERYDVVVVDPPPFSKVKGKVFSALRDWEELVTAIAQVTSPGGQMLVVSNAAKLPEDDLMLAVGNGSAKARARIRLIGELGLPVDFPVPPAFPEGRYLDIKRFVID